jgi:hypothetical protein
LVTRRFLWALVSTAVLTVGCANSRPTAAPRSRLCRAFDSIDWHAPQITERDTRPEVVAKVRAAHLVDVRIDTAATGAIRRVAGVVLSDDDRYHSREIAEWPSTGDGHALHLKAQAAGFFNILSYVESLVFRQPNKRSSDRGLLASDLAESCAGLRLTNAPSLERADAPAGEILAVKLGTGEIHRFSTDGRDLGVLPLPGVGPIVRDVVASPDGRWLAFDAGRPQQFWVVDLTTGNMHPSTSVNCAGFGADASELWAWLGPYGKDFIARISNNGTYERTTVIDQQGCPSQYSSAALLTVTSPIDGGPLHLETVPKNGGHPQTLLTTPCSVANAQQSPDVTAIAYQARCSNEAESGLFLVGRTGVGRRRLVAGTTGVVTWSPDSRWVAYPRYDASHPGDSGYVHVDIVSRDGRIKATVTPPGYSWPIWLPAAPGIATN